MKIKINNMNYRNLLQHEIEELEAQGCYSNDWQQVTVTDDFDPAGIHNAGFDGEVRIGSGVHIRNVGIHLMATEDRGCARYGT